MRVAVEGCAHGELDRIYAEVAKLQVCRVPSAWSQTPWAAGHPHCRVSPRLVECIGHCDRPVVASARDPNPETCATLPKASEACQPSAPRTRGMRKHGTLRCTRAGVGGGNALGEWRYHAACGGSG